MSFVTKDSNLSLQAIGASAVAALETSHALLHSQVQVLFKIGQQLSFKTLQTRSYFIFDALSLGPLLSCLLMPTTDPVVLGLTASYSLPVTAAVTYTLVSLEAAARLLYRHVEPHRVPHPAGDQNVLARLRKGKGDGLAGEAVVLGRDDV